MEWLALAIVISTVLCLVDKNQKWKAFRRYSLWSIVVLIALAVSLALWQQYQQDKPLESHGPWEQYRK